MPKIALVTGAGSGIGRAAALALQSKGWSVVLAGRREKTLEETATLSSHGDGRALIVVADVTRPESVRALFARAVSELGRVDLLLDRKSVV